MRGLDAHFNRQLADYMADIDAAERDEIAQEERYDRIMDRRAEILECDGEIYDAVTDDDDTDAGRMFWESVRDMMEHGGEADDVQFLEAARGVYDAMLKLADQRAEREEDGL